MMRSASATGVLLMVLAGASACTTTGGAGKNQVMADAKALVTASYQCQEALGREPHYSAIESSETVLKATGQTPSAADRIVRGWLKDLIASPKSPAGLDARTCKDRLLTLAEKVRIGYETLAKARQAPG
ncbi:MAG: hypothetical protein ACRECY_13125 [Phyllobacterium sp.]